MKRVVVVGATGYGGAELLRRLLRHPEVEVVRATAADNIGKPLGEVHLNLQGLSRLKIEECTPEQAIVDADLVFLGLPHKVSAHVAARMLMANPALCVVDLSGDFRLRDLAAYEHYYAPHPHPELLGSFVYGLPEMNREAIRSAMRVASPGCFATATILALQPASMGGLLGGAPVRVVAATGSSGSGAAASLGTHHPLRSQNLKAYKVLQHQHVPEIIQALLETGAPADLALDFVPISAPLARGILVTAFVDVPAEMTPEGVSDLYRRSYADEPFVRILDTSLPEVVAVKGSNFVDVGFHLGQPRGDSRTLVCMSALDNLIKGGAGQAVQSMNLMLGCDETETLAEPPLWP